MTGTIQACSCPLSFTLPRLLRCLAGYDVLQVLHRARQPVDAGDYERVALTQELEQPLQLGAVVAAGSTRLLGADDLAAGGPQRGALEGEILVEGGDSGVAVEHGVPVSFGFRPVRCAVSYGHFQPL